jgi:hypothetical protein
MPAIGHPNHEAMMQEVERIFRDNEKNGSVEVNYTTSVIYGQMS